MTIGNWYWLILVLWIVFGVGDWIWDDPRIRRGGNLVLIVLLVLIGLQVMGDLVKGGR